MPLFYWEMFLYPTFHKRLDLTMIEHFVQCGRISSGFGIGVSLHSFKLVLFLNLINFGTRKGDLERRGFSFNLIF